MNSVQNSSKLNPKFLPWVLASSCVHEITGVGFHLNRDGTPLATL
jgi:hypothetical protein